MSPTANEKRKSNDENSASQVSNKKQATGGFTAPKAPVKPSPDPRILADQKSSADRAAQKLLRLQRKSAKTPIFELIQELKPLWEQLRIKRFDDKVKRKKIITTILEMVKGHLGDLIFKHDSSRIVQSIIKFSDTGSLTEGRQAVLAELQGQSVRLAGSPYGRFVVLKAIKYAPNAQWRSKIVTEFLAPKVIVKNIRHKHAGLIIDTIYCLYANAKERQLMIESFYGTEFAITKSAMAMDKTNTGKVTLASVLEKFPDRRARILAQIQDTMINMVSKDGAIGRNEIIHQILFDFISQQTLPEVQALVNAQTAPLHILASELPSLVHTKPGSKLAMIILAASGAKERKSILKECKEFVKAIVCDDAGWMVICRATDCVDDTVLLKQTLISEMIKDTETLRELLSNKSFRRFVLYILVGQDTKFFSPDHIALMNVKSEFMAVTSKKDPATRRAELQSQLLPDLFPSMNQAVLQSLFSDWNGCQLFDEMIKFADSHPAVVSASARQAVVNTMVAIFAEKPVLIQNVKSHTILADSDSEDEEDEELIESAVVEESHVESEEKMAEPAGPKVSKHYIKSVREDTIQEVPLIHPMLNANVSRLFKRMVSHNLSLLSTFSETLINSDSITGVLGCFKDTEVDDVKNLPSSPFFIYLMYIECADEAIKINALKTLSDSVKACDFNTRGCKLAQKFLDQLNAKEVRGA